VAATRVGIIGSGWIVGVHMRVLAAFDDVRVVGIAARNAEAGRRLAEPAGARHYADHRSMLDEAELDAVFVCLPPYAAFEPAMAVVDRGIPIFAEKPLGVDEAGPERIAGVIAAKNLPRRSATSGATSRSPIGRATCWPLTPRSWSSARGSATRRVPRGGSARSSPAGR
jgi:hypothetical protein